VVRIPNVKEVNEKNKLKIIIINNLISFFSCQNGDLNRENKHPVKKAQIKTKAH
jgi:hypothetical protein